MVFGGPRRRRQQSQQLWTFVHRILGRRPLSFRGFALLLLLLAFLAFAPALVFHLRLKRGQVQKCGWLENPPLVCAHGGDSIRAPPNTFEAYNLALKSEVDCIEIDASRTRDGVLVALHDRDLQNMSGLEFLRVGDVMMEEITHLSARYSFPKEFQNHKVQVPTIENALQHVSRSLKQVIIDAKVGPPLFEVSLAADILSVVNNTQCKNCLVWSKADALVRDLKILSPEVMAGYIVMKDPVTGKENDLLRMDGVEVVGVYHGIVNEKLVSDVHRAGKKVHVWTVNDRDVMERMVFEGVDCIVTNYPRELQKVMLEIKQQCKEEGYFM